VYRMRYEMVDTYIGRYEYKLIRVGSELRIRERRAILDNETLRPQGKISFIL
jgi:p-cumate 2,3-dioxygenase subunit beta